MLFYGNDALLRISADKNKILPRQGFVKVYDAGFKINAYGKKDVNVVK